MSEVAEWVLYALPFLLYAYCLVLGGKVARKLYGGRFTAALPPLLGAITLLALQQMLTTFFALMGGVHADKAVVFSLHTLQVLAGILLLQAMYLVYQISFATAGFLEGK